MAERLGDSRSLSIMPVFKCFEQLDDNGFFTDFVKDQFENGWPRVPTVSNSRLITDPELVELASKRYRVNIDHYSGTLKSKNPDHYKRAGALLHALYIEKPVKELIWDQQVERLKDVEAVGVSYGDADYWNRFTEWYGENCCHMMAFDLAFRCCQTHEGRDKQYNQDFLNNMCYYMTTNTNINVGSFVMILKAYWS